MILKIHLQNFRCYEDIWFPNEVSYQKIQNNWKHIFGDNGSGKTSVLEAISLLNAGNGLRSADSSCLGYNGQEWLIMFSFADRDLILKPGKVGRIFIDSTEERDWRKLVSILWSTPQYLAKFCSSKMERRLFLDRAISHESQIYRQTLKKYNFYYKAWGIGCKQHSEDLVRSIEPQLLKLNQELLGLREEWISGLKSIGSFKAAYVKQEVPESLVHFRKNGQASGAHTADLLFKSEINEFTKCSTGQQKFIFISFLYSILLSRNSIYKFLLLDDWYDNFDIKTQNFIQDLIVQYQEINVWSSGVCKI